MIGAIGVGVTFIVFLASCANRQSPAPEKPKLLPQPPEAPENETQALNLSQARVVLGLQKPKEKDTSTCTVHSERAVNNSTIEKLVVITDEIGGTKKKQTKFLVPHAPAATDKDSKNDGLGYAHHLSNVYGINGKPVAGYAMLAGNHLMVGLGQNKAGEFGIQHVGPDGKALRMCPNGLPAMFSPDGTVVEFDKEGNPVLDNEGRPVDRGICKAELPIVFVPDAKNTLNCKSLKYRVHRDLPPAQPKK